MFRAMSNGIAWVLLVVLFLMAFEVVGEVIDIIIALIGRL